MRSGQSVPVVFVTEFPDYIQFAIGSKYCNGRVSYSVEGSCFHHGVVNHILEDDLLANFQRFVESIFFHKIAAQATDSAEAIAVLFCGRVGIGIADTWSVGHFERVGHVGGEGDVEVGRFYPFIINDIEYSSNQNTGIPGECAAGFEYHLQVRVAFSECLNHTDEVVGVVSFPGHQVPSAEVYPFEFGEKGCELFFEVSECVFEVLAGAFAQNVEVQAFDTIGEPAFEVFDRFTESGAG